METIENCKILVVEDSPQMLHLIRTILTKNGFDVIVANNGQEGLDATHSNDVDLIISDVMMPGMDGYEFCQEVRKYGATQALPFIFLSAKGSIRDKQEGFKDGADDYITKPFDPSELVMRVNAMLERTSRYRHEAFTDSLTGLNNRRYFDRKLAEMILHSNRYIEPFCLAMIDVDHFKNFNDTYGHQAGDEALRHLAKCLIEHLRETDLTFRYGGEEFTAILPGTNKDTGMYLMDAFRAKISETVINYEEKKLRLTVSIGLAQSIVDAENSKELLKSADEALYASKTNGRNLTTGFLIK
ncbi:MAG: diguanylate cyclase response regulator [bacterium]|nr:MAG: diguanylate cyclase response regulator [bacterium]